MEQAMPKNAAGGRAKKLFWSAVRIAVMAYVGAIIMAFLFQNRLIYFPTAQIEQTPRDIGLDFEEVSLETADGVRLAAWYIPAAAEGGRTLIFCHGNGGNISHRLDKLAIFHGLGLNVMIFDYRGYGASAGRPNEKGTYLDAQAAYDWVVKEKGALPRDIIAYGESLGGSIAAHLAGTNECGGLILDSAFTSLAAVGQRHFPWLPVRWIVGNKYDTTAFLAKVNCPVLVIHSRDDEIVPFDMGEELFRLAREPKKFVEIRGTHNEGFIESEDAYVQELRDWLQESEKRKAINEK